MTLSLKEVPMLYLLQQELSGTPDQPRNYKNYATTNSSSPFTSQCVIMIFMSQTTLVYHTFTPYKLYYFIIIMLLTSDKQ